MVRSSTPELRAFFRPSPPPDANIFCRSMAISVSMSDVVLLSCARFSNLVEGVGHKGDGFGRTDMMYIHVHVHT